MNYIECRVGDYFEIHPTKAYKGNNPDLFCEDGKIPVVANNTINNGIGGYSNLEPTEKGGIITFSDTTTSDAVFFQPTDFIGYAHVQGMYPKSDKWTEKSLKYFMILFKKYAQSRGFDYGNKFNRAIAAEFIILLPSSNGVDPDFKYMEKCIDKIEKNKYKKIYKYIEKKYGTNIRITKSDRKLLLSEVKYGEFRFDELLTKVKTKSLKYKAKSLPKVPSGEFTLPALTAGINNQGLSCYVPYDGATVLKNCISVSANGANTGAMFYQPTDFTVLQDSYALKPKNDNVSGRAQLYLICAMQHVVKDNYDWTNKAGWEKIRGKKMIIPIDENNLPNYNYMDAYIKIQEKKIYNKLIS